MFSFRNCHCATPRRVANVVLGGTAVQVESDPLRQEFPGGEDVSVPKLSAAASGFPFTHGRRRASACARAAISVRFASPPRLRRSGKACSGEEVTPTAARAPADPPGRAPALVPQRCFYFSRSFRRRPPRPGRAGGAGNRRAAPTPALVSPPGPPFRGAPTCAEAPGGKPIPPRACFADLRSALRAPGDPRAAWGPWGRLRRRYARRPSGRASANRIANDRDPTRGARGLRVTTVARPARPAFSSR